MVFNDIFNKQEHDQIVVDYSNLVLVPEHKVMISRIAKVLKKFIDLPETILEGFCWSAMQQYQEVGQVTVKEVSTKPPSSRISITEDIFGILQGNLIKSLKDKTNLLIIANGVDSAFNFYKDNYGYR